MDLTIQPGALSGKVAVPPSKAAVHRAVICAALAGGGSEIRGVDRTKDLEATVACATALGASCSFLGRPP